jgi:four helix bundle protein
MEIIKNHRELRVYQKAFDATMRIFELSKKFPKEEMYSLTDQIRKSSRSVCSNIARHSEEESTPNHFPLS